MTTEPTYWKKCSTCKKEIGFSTKYYLCSVSTCKHKRKGFTFCSPSCWSEHLAFANHREAWAEDFMSPSKSELMAQSSDSNDVPSQPRRKIISDGTPKKSAKTDTLVVVSKVKKFIKDQSDMNTSQCCIERLTEKVVYEALKGIDQARASGRKTVMGRDIL